jgi:hypothetical protein
MSPSLVPQSNHEVYFVLCKFGDGQAYVETDPMEADWASIVRKFIAGEYDHPISVLACNQMEGWARDVSVSIAREIAKTDDDLTAATRAFIDRLLTHSGATNE